MIYDRAMRRKKPLEIVSVLAAFGAALLTPLFVLEAITSHDGDHMHDETSNDNNPDNEDDGND